MLESRGACSTLSERIRAVRLDLFGECGGPMLATLLGVTQRKLMRMEAGGPMPDWLILKLIEVTGANPDWLLSGEGPRSWRPATSYFGGRRFGSQSDG